MKPASENLTTLDIWQSFTIVLTHLSHLLNPVIYILCSFIIQLFLRIG